MSRKHLVRLYTKRYLPLYIASFSIYIILYKKSPKTKRQANLSENFIWSKLKLIF